MLVIDKTYEFTVWTCEHIARFSRAHRFTLGDRLERQVNRVLEGLLRARYDRGERLLLLRQVNVELELLRFQLRLARDLKCLSLDSFGHAASVLTEVGRMVGGWIRTSSQPQASPGDRSRPAFLDPCRLVRSSRF